MATVYLAGGMDAGWRNAVMAGCPHHHYLSPVHRNDVELEAPREYTTWDLAAISHSDIVLGYIASDNPSGYGLALEVGYAVGLGLPVILVDKKQDERMAIVRAAASICLKDIEEAIKVLRAVTW